MINKIYVLVSDSLPPAQKAVQACHAVAQLIMQNNIELSYQNIPTTPNLILYVVKEHQLASYMEKLSDYKTAFYEPDIGNVLTAIAYYGAYQEFFQTLKLY